MTSDVFECVVEVLEEFNPPSLSPSDLLGLSEILEVLVVSEDPDWVFRAEKQGATTLESEDDSCEFFIMNIIVLFCREKASGVEGDGVHPVLMLLGNDNAQGVPRRVGMHDERFIPIWSLQDRFLGADIFQVAEGCLAAVGPVPLTVFACEVIEGTCDVGEVRNEGSIEVTKP